MSSWCYVILYLCSWLKFSRLIVADPYWIPKNAQVQEEFDTLGAINPQSSESIYDKKFTDQYLCYLSGRCISTDNTKKNRRQTSKFQTIFQWNQLEFDYPSDEYRNRDIERQIFVPGKPAPIDVDVHYDGTDRRIFVTIPRFQTGSPATLGTVVLSKDGAPLIKPYPSWEWNRYPEECRYDRIVSVYRVTIDKCNRLWVLDTGRLAVGQVCPMQILAFDLKQNRLVYRKAIPSTIVRDTSILVTPIVELLTDNCAEAFAYMADVVGYSIIVYDAKKGTFWKVSDKTMFPYPNYSAYDIFGDKFDLVDGVLGMALGPRTASGGHKLFYHALSSVTENWVDTNSLRNQSLFGEYPWVHPDVFHVYKGTRKSQSAAIATDQEGILYFGLLDRGSMNCWNTATEYGDENIDVIEINEETLQFPSGVKVRKNSEGVEELWILTSRLQKVITGSLGVDEVNFRILKVNVEDALKGTKCKGAAEGGSSQVDDDRIVFY